jgi:hypothetical protein
MPNQPPFLYNAKIPAWIETLNRLMEPKFSAYTLVGGRNGVIKQEDVRFQIRYLQKIRKLLEDLKNQNAPESEIDPLIPELLTDFDGTPVQMALYRKRLSWGLTMYYLRNYFPEKIKEPEA